MREPGFYWVRFDDDRWEVAEWCHISECWFRVYREEESYIAAEIDERRIERGED